MANPNADLVRAVEEAARELREVFEATDQPPASTVLAAQTELEAAWEELVSLAPGEQLAAFAELRVKSPAAFAVSARAAMLWRLREALACYRDANWNGAANWIGR